MTDIDRNEAESVHKSVHKLVIKTDTQARSATLPPDKTELRIPVIGETGLYLLVRNSSKSWLYRWKTGGQVKTRSIGKYPRVGLSDARQRARECRGAVESGQAPVSERTAVRQAAQEIAGQITVEKLFTTWLDRYLKLERKDEGIHVKSLFEKYVNPEIGDMLATKVRRSDVARVLDGARSLGVSRTVELLLSSMRQMWGYAIDRGVCELDPTSRMKASKFGARSQPRGRVLSPPEIVQLAKQLRLSSPNDLLPGTARLKDETKLAIWLLLATGLRISELLTLHWKDVDLKNRTASVLLPDTKTKKHRQVVSLSQFAIDRFKELAAITRQRGQNPGWCWPAMRTSDKPLCVKTISKQIKDRQLEKPIRGRSKATNVLLFSGEKWIPHDLRRTAATLLGDAGIDPNVIEKILNHQDDNKIRRTYQRQALVDQKVAAWNALGSILEDLRAKADRESNI
jgi:integrase